MNFAKESRDRRNIIRYDHKCQCQQFSRVIFETRPSKAERTGFSSVVLKTSL